MKNVIIMRGLPGSGKSTLAGLIANEYSPAIVCSADHFFQRGFEYKFNPKLIGKAHEACKSDFLEAIEKYKCETIIVDNTNTQPWEWEWYKQQAKKHGYNVSIIRVDTDLSDEELAARNKHGVPLETIRKMRERMK